MATDLQSARKYLNDIGVAGWLTRDYRYTNPIFFAALGYRPSNLTRPVWLWIPADSEPRLLAHDVTLTGSNATTLRSRHTAAASRWCPHLNQCCRIVAR